MSTRCNIIVKDDYSQLWFYRHCDGYPSATGESLKRFLKLLIDGRIRDNVGQASGWLILLGAMEYQSLPEGLFPQHGKKSYERDDKTLDAMLDAFNPADWQCGAYEPTTGQHGDIEYLYVIDLIAKEIRCCRPGQIKSPFYVVTAENIELPIGKDSE